MAYLHVISIIIMADLEELNAFTEQKKTMATSYGSMTIPRLQLELEKVAAKKLRRKNGTRREVNIFVHNSS